MDDRMSFDPTVEAELEIVAPENTNLIMTRRAALTGLAATAALTFAGGERADAQGNLAAARTSYAKCLFFQAPALEQGIIAVLIGLLLPAVQKVREPARAALVDSAGNIYPLSIPAGAGNDTVAVEFRIRNRYDENRERFLVVTGLDGKSFEIPSDDGLLYALLLPAVMPDGTSAGIHAGSVNVLMGDGSVRYILPYVEQDNLRVQNGEASPMSVGPAFMQRGSHSLIGLLLPAVQKVREPFRLQLADGTGNFFFNIEALPLMDKPSTHFFDIFVGDEGIRIMRNGEELPLLGAPKNNVLIGLLLPAVQKVRDGTRSVPPLGGSLMLPNTTVGFEDNFRVQR